MERWYENEIVYRGRIINLRAGTAELDDGTLAGREVVEHPGGIGVVPFTGDSIIFVRQYRIAVESHLLEIPAGKREGGEPPEQRGRLELEEEIGRSAGSMESLGLFYPSPGVFGETMYLFLARDLSECEARPEHDERIEIVELPLDEVRARLAQNEFTDGKTIVGLERFFRMLDAG